MNVLPHCTGCRCGRCLVRPTLREVQPTASAPPGAGWAYRPGKNPFARVEQLSPRVWLVVEDDRFCEHPFMYVVLGQRRTVVIDTGVGTASYGTWLTQWLTSTHGPEVAARPLLVINSHCHYDHIGSNASLAPRCEAPCPDPHPHPSPKPSSVSFRPARRGWTGAGGERVRPGLHPGGL